MSWLNTSDMALGLSAIWRAATGLGQDFPAFEYRLISTSGDGAVLLDRYVFARDERTI
jgi:hypothetical protein